MKRVHTDRASELLEEAAPGKHMVVSLLLCRATGVAVTQRRQAEAGQLLPERSMVRTLFGGACCRMVCPSVAQVPSLLIRGRRPAPGAHTSLLNSETDRPACLLYSAPMTIHSHQASDIPDGICKLRDRVSL